jgi:hypothetical protein
MFATTEYAQATATPALDALLIGHGPKRARPENSIRVVIAGVEVDLDID